MAESDNALARNARRRLGSSLCGRYSLLRLIGVGGMAAVYDGIHRNGHAVAIKILHDRVAADPEIERLFRREAQLANKVDHPGVVSVIDDDVTEDGCVFLVMPRLHGETLRARVERCGGVLPPREVVVIAHAILETLGAAHARKIVHRDIKPENVFVTMSGELKVLDFGIGGFFESKEAAGATRTGRALGTPAFMAPEQALGRVHDVDGRTDLWALGATMFSLLSGRFVHEAMSGMELAILTATRSARALESVAPEVPAPLRDVVDRALSFDRADRWDDATAMARALGEACVAAFGCSVAELPRVTAPADTSEIQVDAASTRSPWLDIGGPRTGSALLSPFAASAAAPPVPSSTLRMDPAHDAPLRATGGGLARSTGGLASGHRPVPAGKATRRLAVGAALVAMGALGVTLASLHGKAPASGPPGGDAAKMDMASLDADSVAQCQPPARAHLAAGIQLWRDSSQWDALPRLESALAADPTCAAASVYYVMATSNTWPRRREHYRMARDLRGQLGPRLRDLLDVLSPTVADPPDNADALARAAALVARAPSDADAQRLHARMFQRLGQWDKALAAVDAASPRLAAPDPGLEMIAANSYLRTGDSPSALKRLEQCLAIAPDSTDCLYNSAVSYAGDGKCELAESSLRRQVSVAPHGALGYALLGDVLLAATGDPKAARGAFEQRWQNMGDPAPGDAPNPTIARLMDEYRMAVFGGDLRAALKLATEWGAAVAPTNVGRFRAESAIAQIDLLRELGETEEARARAAAAVREQRSWTGDSVLDFGIELPRLAYLTGAMDAATFREQRAAWVSRAKPTDTALWLAAYAGLPLMNDEMPPPIAPGTLLVDSSASPIESFSRAAFGLLQRGRTADARIHAQAAADICVGLRPMSWLRAQLSLAMVYEATGAADDACRNYERLATMLRPTPESTTGAYAAKRRQQLHCDQRNP